jgi:hypothetical protein
VFGITKSLRHIHGIRNIDVRGATGRQGVLTPPRHLIPPPVFPGVRVSPFVYLTCNSYLNWIYQRWDQVLDKHGPLDIPEVGSGVRQTQTLDIPEVGSGVKQTQTPGYTRGGIKC